MKSIVTKDLPASMVVFLIALPLSLGIALASGAPIKAGIIAAIVGGLVVGLTGGAPLQVSGPAAGLTVMVYGLIKNYGLDTTLCITIAGGLLQMLLGGLRVASLTMMISPAVIHAMLAGIGVLITLGQFHTLLGFKPYGSAIDNILNLSQSLNGANRMALTVGIITFITLALWNRFLSNKVRWLPGALVAVSVGTLSSFLFKGDLPRVQINAQLFDHINMPVLTNLSWSEFIFASLGLALVASAESLLCAVATDKLHGGPRSKLNQELFAQGLGNAVSGLLGGLPITGVIVRSSANISAGAESRFSAIFHAVWIFLFSTFFSKQIGHIPLAVLAALLIHIGLQLVKLKEIKHLLEFKEILIYAVTLFGVVFVNLLAGIGMGICLSVIVLLYRIGKVDLDVREEESGKLEITIKGNLSFVCVPRLLTELRKITPGQKINLHLDILQIDYSAVEAIRGWKIGYENTGGEVYKKSLDELWKGQWKTV